MGLVALVAVLAIGLVAVPATYAAKKKPSTTRKQEKTQNTAIKKGAKAIKTLNSDLVPIKAIAKSAPDALAQIQTALGALATGLTSAGSGLTALQTAATALNAGLTSLKTLATSTEYGFVVVSTSSSIANAVPGCFYESSDIPDNVNDAIVSGSCLMSGVTAGQEIHFLAGIRGTETDGVAGGDAAGVAGIVAYKQTSAGCAAVPCAVLAGGGATVPAGSGQPPAVTIPLTSPPTSTTETGFPFGPISTDKVVDLSTTQFSGTPATPVEAAAGNPIDFTIRFNDLTADPNNPSA